MDKTNNCNLMDDLLPLYVDGLISEEGAELVRQHLNVCPACAEKAKRLSQTLVVEPNHNDEAKTQAQKVKKKFEKRLFLSLGSLALCGVLIFSVLFFPLQAKQKAYADQLDAYSEQIDTYSEQLASYAEQLNAYAEQTNNYAEQLDAYYTSLLYPSGWDPEAYVLQKGNVSVSLTDVPDEYETLTESTQLKTGGATTEYTISFSFPAELSAKLNKNTDTLFVTNVFLYTNEAYTEQIAPNAWVTNYGFLPDAELKPYLYEYCKENSITSGMDFAKFMMEYDLDAVTTDSTVKEMGLAGEVRATRVWIQYFGSWKPTYPKSYYTIDGDLYGYALGYCAETPDWENAKTYKDERTYYYWTVNLQYGDVIWHFEIYDYSKEILSTIDDLVEVLQTMSFSSAVVA